MNRLVTNLSQSASHVPSQLVLSDVFQVQDVRVQPLCSAVVYHPVILPGVWNCSNVLLWARPASTYPFRPRGKKTRATVFVACLLLAAGDVEYNPGPATSRRAGAPSSSTFGISARASGSATSRCIGASDRLTCKQLHFGSFNIRSAAPKAALLHDVISDQRLHFIALQET